MISSRSRFILTTLLTLSCAAPAFAGTQIGNAELSANVGLVSDYSFRGISQSDEGPAIQGGFDIVHNSGLYAGIWASSVDFGDADIETDFYAGYSSAIGDVSYDLGLIYYAYPGADSDLDYDFYELSAALGYDFGLFSTAASVNVSPEYFGDSGHAEYYALAVDVPLPYDLSLNGHVGYQAIEDNAAFGTPDYTDWGAGIGYNWEGFDLGLSYVDTDLDEPGDCADGCDSRVVFSIGRSF